MSSHPTSLIEYSILEPPCLTRWRLIFLMACRSASKASSLRTVTSISGVAPW